MEQQEKKSIFKKWWFWVVALIAISIVVSSLNDSKEKAQQTVVQPEQKTEQVATEKDKTNTVPVSEKKEMQLPKSNPVSTLPSQITTSKISGLSSIRISGGIWENWNANMANDGATIEIVYLDSLGDIISDNTTEQLPISADVKVYTTDTNSIPYKKGRLVFSAHYSTNQIILGNIYPKIRIPKEQISVNPSVDYEYGYVSVTIQTPEQGDFSAQSEFIVLYEK
jgi:hypothetical protein